MATNPAHQLGESPVWDPVRQRLLWVDILDGSVYVGRFASDGEIQIEDRVQFPDLATAVAVAEDGTLIVTGRERVYIRTPSGSIRAGMRILPTDSGRRLNDAKADPAGRIVVGTMSTTADSHTEQLLRVETDGALTVIDDDLTLSNGLAWSSDGSQLFSADSMSRQVFVRGYDPRTGAVGTRTALFEVADGLPDGMCIDMEGCLWVAVWGAGRVDRFTPEGQFLHSIDVPAPHTSSVAFAGPDLGTLVVTTATNDLDARQLDEFPLSGRVFTVEVDVHGADPLLWSGIDGLGAQRQRVLPPGAV